MRGLCKLAAVPGRPTTTAAAAAFSSHTYSTFSGGGAAGGRGRGRGSGPPFPSPPPPRVPGNTNPDDDDAFIPPGLGHGRGHPILPSSPVLPSFQSWISPSPAASGLGSGRGEPLPLPRPTPGLGLGRGRGIPQSPTESPDSSHPKKPIFFRRDDDDPPVPVKPQSSNQDFSAPLPSRNSPILPGAGRGRPAKTGEPADRPKEENRHIRARPPSQVPVRRGPQQEDQRASPTGGGRGGRGGRGRGGRGVMRGRGRGGRFGGRGRDSDESEESALYLGDPAAGERLEKKLGEGTMKQLTEGFDEMSWRVLPSPLDDAYLEALHTNNMIEYEPEYLVEFDNPDIDEKPPMTLEEALEKAKPFLIAYEGIQSQEEWEEAVKDAMERVPHMKELMDMYCGPDRVTAKQQQQELERVAKTLPENIPSSVRRFTDRAVLSLQSNPGWGWDKKCQFMDKLAWEVSRHYS